ncbi:KR domain-containing protein [Nocardia sp. NPDC020380]|uniref:KR domain-containing protein n=1 Tax=Nocardia sp. NPDC020380 TaxID=3364309 RepID=UPI003787ABD7
MTLTSGPDIRADRSVLPVQRFVWRPMELEPLPAEPSPQLLGRRIAVLGGSEASVDRVMVALRAGGAAPLRLAPPQTGGDAADFYRAVCPIDGIIDLNHERPLSLSESGDWEAQLLQTIELLQQCYPDWRAETGSERLFYLAVTRLDGRHGYAGGRIAQPLGGLWAGLAKGLPREFDTVNIRVLDFPAHRLAIEPLDDEMADVICRELYRWGYFEIGHDAGRRYTLVADRADVPPPSVDLGPGDVVVMSGGGRGIGFELARRLCQRHGCRVIISGTSPLPDPADPIAQLPDRDFREYRDRRLIEAARQHTLRQTRAELSRLERSRRLVARLDAARADGLDLVYHHCDVTDPAQVRALLAAAGPKLAGVIHNAGVDTPVRLPAKSPQAIRHTVGVKVTGLLNLLAALADHPPIRFFSTAGSLAGRWGGMVGQLEYGAANDALSRIGLWAAAEGSDRIPVATMCWPTWERLGIITNYEATLAYMSAMRVEEGLHHWEDEILAGTAGEFTFVGEFGRAWLPSLLRGYHPAADLAGLDRLAARLLFLGTPIRFAAGAMLEIDLDISPDTFPACLDFRVDGSPAVPLSVLLEFMRSLGDWVQPDGVEQRLSGMHDIRIDLTAIGVDDPGARLRATAEGRWGADGAWEVVVRVRRGGVPVARTTLRYGNGIETRTTSADLAIEAESKPARPVRRLQWSGHRMRDLVLDAPAPRPDLPLDELETRLRDAYVRQALDSVRYLTIDSIEYARDSDTEPEVHEIRYGKG